ncbi:MAG: nucleotidyltransferase family protein [Acutalibacteraceae bacterium]
MNIYAIISEYNPFHNGHKYMTDTLRRNGATHIAAIMGGSFLQRGEPALFSKYARARCALENGVDLVIELPQIYAGASAFDFAYGGASVADALGCVNHLAFGSECGDIELLTQTAQIMESEAYKAALKNHLSLGKSYARACCEALGELCPDKANILEGANNTLAIEYIRSLIKLKSNIKPVTVERRGAMHDEHNSSGGIASASYIRKLIRENDSEFYRLIPENTLPIIKEEIKNGRISDIKNLERAILHRLRSMSLEELKNLPDVTEGLENRLFKAVRSFCTVDEIINEVKTKRYTHAKIRRIIMSAFLGIDNKLAGSPLPYIRVLGFNARGIEILRQAKESARLPIITKVSDSMPLLNDKQKRLFELDIKATDLQGLSFAKIPPCGDDYFIGNVRA